MKLGLHDHIGPLSPEILQFEHYRPYGSEQSPVTAMEPRDIVLDGQKTKF